MRAEKEATCETRKNKELLRNLAKERLSLEIAERAKKLERKS